MKDIDEEILFLAEKEQAAARLGLHHRVSAYQEERSVLFLVKAQRELNK